VPEISRFFGIIIRMYYDEHDPPHFHAIYGDAEGQVGIDPIHVLSGDLPNRVVSLVVEWAALHQFELRGNWDRLRTNQQPNKIVPLQ
jgi:hypothetical protein